MQACILVRKTKFWFLDSVHFVGFFITLVIFLFLTYVLKWRDEVYVFYALSSKQVIEREIIWFGLFTIWRTTFMTYLALKLKESPNFLH